MNSSQTHNLSLENAIEREYLSAEENAEIKKNALQEQNLESFINR